MKKILLALLAVLTVATIAGVAIAADPGGHVQNARNLLAQADAELQAAIAEPPVTVTQTVTITQTVTQTVPPVTTTVPTSSTTTAPPPAGFPTRDQALARPNVVVLSGTRTTQYKPPPSTDITDDFRGLTSTAYPSTGYPIVLEGTRNVAIGGVVIGQQPRTWTWEQVHDGIGGYGGRMLTNDYSVWYDFRVDNVTDGLGFDPLAACGTAPAPSACEFLVDT